MGTKGIEDFWIRVVCVKCRAFIAEMQTRKIRLVPIVLCSECYERFKDETRTKT